MTQIQSPINGGETRPARFRTHPDRAELAGEMHARPPLPLQAPLAITHIALLTGESGYGRDFEHIGALARQLKVATPERGGKHHVFDLGDEKLTWERHTEFTTYAMIRPLPEDPLFATSALEALPSAWLDGLPGTLIAGTHVALVKEGGPGAPRGETDLARIFGTKRYMGSHVMAGLATIYTDMRLHPDGFGRVVIVDKGLPDYQAGRVVKWVLEIETYRMMALMALTAARAAQPRIAALEEQLTSLSEAMREEATDADKAALARLTRISADVEKVSLDTRYRFAASRAYHDLVRRRIEFLQGAPVHGLPSIGAFIENRLAPAMNTMESVARRLDALGGAITRALGVIRTKVDIVLEDQNQELMTSMERRVRQQVLLTQAVEGLSVVAISYYATGLVSWGAKALKSAGLPINPDLAAGLALPVIVIGTWYLIHKRRSEVDNVRPNRY